MQFKAKIKDIVKTFKGGYVINIATEQKLSEEEINELSNKDLQVKIEKWREKRSISSNAYCWVLCEKIAQKIKNITKEEVYKEEIKKVGVFEILPIRADVVQTFKQRWESKGLGWLCEIMRDSKIKGYVNVFAYYGSSTYNTEEMSRLINEIVHDAKELGIQTETPDKIAEMLSLWEQEK